MNRMEVEIDDHSHITRMNCLGTNLQPIVVKSFEVFKNDKSYISWSLGSYIEFFRILKNRGKKKKKKKLIEHFEINKIDWFKKYKNPFPDFNPDYIQVFYPKSRRRKKIIDCFFNVLKLNKEKDMSSHFVKNTKKSIVKRPFEEATSRFDFNPKGLKPMKKLLIIDDAIDSGTTITIFLNHLIKHNLINEFTQIKAICIYNVFKRQDKQNERNERKRREISEYDKKTHL